MEKYVLCRSYDVCIIVSYSSVLYKLLALCVVCVCSANSHFVSHD